MGVTYSSTKLKVQLKTAVQRMNMSLNKRGNSIKVESRLVASLLQNNKDESARIKVEGIIHAKNMITVMETLQLMCELLATRIQLITHSTDCPADLEESIATIVYCASRVEIPELEEIARQFAAKYGEKYIRSHINNESGKVNPRIIDKLKISAPEFDVVINILQEIAAEYQLEWKPDLVVLESGIRDSNPERLGAIAGGPKISAVEIKEEEIRDSFPEPPKNNNRQTPSPTPPPASSQQQQQKHRDGTIASLPQKHLSPDSYPSPTYPATLNVIILQAKDFPVTDTNTETIIKVSQPETGLTWRSLPPTSSIHTNTTLLSWSNQHCPVAVSSPTVRIMVEAILIHHHDNHESIIGGLSIEVEQLRRSANGTWYMLFSSGTHQPVGQVLLAAQFMPLPDESRYHDITNMAARPSATVFPSYSTPDFLRAAPQQPPPPSYQEEGNDNQPGTSDILGLSAPLLEPGMPERKSM